ncbi:MAG: hypothetical protein R6V85_05980 [Polyangia bacterium]
MRRCAAISCLLVLSSAALAPRGATATEARLESLAELALVDDEVDIADFPGMLCAYSDLLFLNAGPAQGWSSSDEQISMTGSLGALFGREVALGAWLHRTPRYDDLAETEQLFELSADIPTNYTLADLFLGFSSGFGLRLGISAGLDSEEEYDDDGDALSSGGTTFAADLQLGYSFDAEGYHGDFGAGVTLSYFELFERGDTIYEGELIPSFLVRHRSIIGPRRELAGVFDVRLSRRAYTAATRASEKELEQSGEFGRWLLEVTAGPRLRLPRWVEIWIGLRFGFENLAGKIDKQEQPTLRSIAFPGAGAALEVTPLEMLVVRAGASYDVAFSVSEAPLPEEIDSDEGEGFYAGKQRTSRRFHWSTGLGLRLADFRVDATVAQRLFVPGPYMITGQPSGFLGMLSGAYAW